MTSLSYINTVLPEHEVVASNMSEVGEAWLADDLEAQEKFLRIGSRSGVATRRFAFPYSSILTFNGLEHRANKFELAGTKMLANAIDQALVENDQDPAEVGALVFTSCSVPLIPSIDAAAILSSRLPSSLARVPIYQHGCAGGVVGLALGAKLAQLGKPVLVASVELCSLVFQPKNHSGAHLVGAAIFADGAAATVISPERGALSVIASESRLLPDTRHLMGYDIFDDGFHLRLDRALPSKLIHEAPNVVTNFLAKQNCTPDDVDYWIFHPGGIKILDFLRSTFKLSKEQCQWAYTTLNDHGNLSSATIFYVIDAFLKDPNVVPGKKALIMGIGPGLTIELILVEN